MDRILKIGMLGCGEIAYEGSGPSIKKARNAEMIVAMDPVGHVAASFGQDFRMDHTTELEDVLGNDEVDAVVISAPHYMHEPLTVQAARAGKHVMCEKPIACTLEQADRMIEACRETGVLLSINMVTRYSAVTIKGRELVDQGVVGKIMGLQFHVMADKPTSYWSGGYSGRVPTDWRPSVEQSGGGVLVMNLVHDIDRFRYMTGLEVVRAYSEFDTFATDVEVEDYIAVTYRYDNGAIGNATASSCAKGRGGTGNRIVGRADRFRFKESASFHHRRVRGIGVW
jgi:predicted dehydrogenase